MKDPSLIPAPQAAIRLIQPLANYLGLRTLPYHAHEIAAAYLFYQTLSAVVSPAICRRLKVYQSLPRRSQIDWDVRVVSFVQATLISCAALYVIRNDAGRATADWQARLWGYNGAAGMVQAFAAGYFIWDVVISTLHIDVEGVSSLLHAISALLITCIGFRPFANYYGLNFVLYELSTPFLNIHWWLDKCGKTGSTAQLVNGILLLASFAGSRLVWGTYQSVLIYHDIWNAWNHRPTDACAQAGAALSVECHTMPAWLAVLYLGGNTMLSILNFFWFSKMIAALRKRFQADGREGGPKKEKAG